MFHEASRSGHKRVSSWTKHPSKVLGGSGKFNVIVAEPTGNPVIGHIKWSNRRLTLAPTCNRYKLNPPEPLPALQLRACVPELLRLFLRKSRCADPHRIIPRAIKWDARGNDRISVFDQDVLRTRNQAADLSILFGQILKVIRNEWLGRQLTDRRIVLRVQ